MPTLEITPERFCKAWRDEWEAMGDQEKHCCREAFQGGSGVWTEYMVNSEEAFLARVGDRLGFNKRLDFGLGLDEHAHSYVIRERDSVGIYRLDMSFIADGYVGHPSGMDVVIEHEGKMLKALFVHVPLRVIVFYDGVRDRPQHTLKDLCKTLDDAEELCAEHEEAEYLFIIGDLSGESTEDSQLRWRWSSYAQPLLQALCG